MDMSELRIIKAVADTGSFSGAALELNYVQSHISTQVQRIEAEVGAPLFLRHNRGVTLTRKGELFLQYADEMTRLLSEMSRMMEESDVPAGRLRIASMQTTAATFLPSLLSGYHNRYPDVRLQIHTGTSKRNIQSLLDDAADAAFTAEKVKNKNIVSLTLLKEHLVVLSADPLSVSFTPSDLENRTLLCFPHGCAYRAALEGWLSSSGIVPKNIIEFDALPAVLAAACAGLGVTLLPESAARQYLQDGFLYAGGLPSKWSTLPLYLVYRKEQGQFAALSELIKLAKEHCREDASSRSSKT